jgi:hypothetical protein
MRKKMKMLELVKVDKWIKKLTKTKKLINKLMLKVRVIIIKLKLIKLEKVCNRLILLQEIIKTKMKLTRILKSNSK